jgi:hypothetical protein
MTRGGCLTLLFRDTKLLADWGRPNPFTYSTTSPTGTTFGTKKSCPEVCGVIRRSNGNDQSWTEFGVPISVLQIEVSGNEVPWLIFVRISDLLVWSGPSFHPLMYLACLFVRKQQFQWPGKVFDAKITVTISVIMATFCTPLSVNNSGTYIPGQIFNGGFHPY